MYIYIYIYSERTVSLYCSGTLRCRTAWRHVREMGDSIIILAIFYPPLK